MAYRILVVESLGFLLAWVEEKVAVPVVKGHVEDRGMLFDNRVVHLGPTSRRVGDVGQI